jgi:hypothetical protein
LNSHHCEGLKPKNLCSNKYRLGGK